MEAGGEFVVVVNRVGATVGGEDDGKLEGEIGGEVGIEVGGKVESFAVSRRAWKAPRLQFTVSQAPEAPSSCQEEAWWSAEDDDVGDNKSDKPKAANVLIMVPP
eukprot:gene4683-5732_t